MDTYVNLTATHLTATYACVVHHTCKQTYAPHTDRAYVHSLSPIRTSSSVLPTTTPEDSESIKYYIHVNNAWVLSRRNTQRGNLIIMMRQPR